MGWDWFYVGNRLQETQPSQILRKQPDDVSMLSLRTYVPNTMSVVDGTPLS